MHTAQDGRARQLKKDIATVRSFAIDIITDRRRLLSQSTCTATAATAAAAAEAAAGRPDVTEERHSPASPTASSDSADSFRPPDQIASGDADKPAAAGKAAAAAGGNRPAGEQSADDESSDGPSDLLALFMTEVGPEGAPLGDDELIDTVLNFIIAGAR